MKEDAQVKKKSPVSSWGRLILFSFLIWVFGWVVGPYIENTIPTYRKIAKTGEERGIGSAASMYQDSVGSYDAEYYLIDSFRHSGRDDFGFTFFFFSGVAGCILILWLGWRYIM